VVSISAYQAKGRVFVFLYGNRNALERPKKDGVNLTNGRKLCPFLL
jgi:hypothetical protein